MLNKFFHLPFNISYFKKIKLPLNLDVTVFFFKKQIFLIFKNSHFNYYFLCPLFFNFFFNNFFCFLVQKVSIIKINYKILYSYLKQLNIILGQLVRVNFQTYFIRGTGLKVNLLDNSTMLNLRVGYSHLINIPINPTIISTNIFKKKLIISSFNKMLLGNFAACFYKYRPINVFTGKGFLKKQKKKFKLKEYIKKL